MLCQNQELESPANGAEVGEGTYVSHQAKGENRQVVMKDRKDSVNHLFESLPGVATGDSG